MRSSQSCERREKSGRGAERAICFGLDYGGCFLELEALTININGTELIKREGQAVQIETQQRSGQVPRRVSGWPGGTSASWEMEMSFTTKTG